MVRITENKTNLIDRGRETGHEKKERKKEEKERRSREKIKRKGQKIRAKDKGNNNYPPNPLPSPKLERRGRRKATC
ncbi:hypothetical protein HCJ58_14470 [Listeria sp. FSL L7-1509]|uniref:Uncharacterized protein n=1 Tax=Listeria immobilis TaxID=2713502 RepID=A0ABR6T0N6_9LIST|nr:MULTISPECIES: hypothetical protein [Listeria]MBC1483989.1 hypothetical protein [Listeria immobilis]MBC1508159.1 hypothetical protein [Listeria immobilis]MBC1511178.1 hypothetical protein [Listeria immobilis]MBC1839545.1 hypothetical protein [Listeria seeligeri]MBC6313665.1 hypothetical protein [Listeria immobilis]